ncbi:GspH/FimT family protein [Marinobacter sp. M-5]|uniref:GspH/FimT family pseudopilin n=1 Tax=Marinobacter sp. M-5 TaxID=3081089 RepID=UPI00293CBEDF|nr:GspH/FimT family protein [Marinobacter sp. M-5]MDV3505355.1 GspH/FimT family protein [Marinobacter sp. M-5]
MKFSSRDRGITLVEMLVVLVIVAIVAMQVTPSFTRLLSTSDRHSEISDLITLINVARNTAIYEQTTVTLCPVDADSRCSRDWKLPLVAFRDPQRTKTVAMPSQIIWQRQINRIGTIRGATGIHTYFQFNSSGLAYGAIGNITWCPDNGDATLAAQIRINMGGRPTLAKDRDGDDIVEDSGGRPVACS